MFQPETNSFLRKTVGIASDDQKLVDAIISVLIKGGYEPLIFSRQEIVSGIWPVGRCRVIIASPQAFCHRQEGQPSALRSCVILALARETLAEYRFSIPAADAFILADENLNRLPSLIALSRFGLSMMPNEMTQRQMGVSPQLLRLGQLSRLDRNVLTELGRGGTNQSIALQLGIPVSRTKVHIRRIISRLGFRNRTDAAIFAATIASVSNTTTSPGTGTAN